MSTPEAGDSQGTARFGYEVRIRCVLGPALVSAFPLIAAKTTIHRNTLFRFQAVSERDLTDVFELLSSRGVTVEGIRAAAPTTDDTGCP